MKMGIGSYTFGWASGTYGASVPRNKPLMTAQELIHQAVLLGVQVVQICLLPDLSAWSKEDLKALAALARASGVQIELGTEGSDPRNLGAWLEAARWLDARFLRTILLNPSPGFRHEAHELSEMLPDFEDAGVRIGIENHESSGAQELADLVTSVASPNLGVCLDSVNSLGRGEGVREVTEILLPHVINLHLKDFRAVRGKTNMGFRIEGTALGEGRLDIQYLLEAAHSIDPDMTVVIEQWTELAGTVDQTCELQTEWADRGVAHLRSTLATLDH